MASLVKGFLIGVGVTSAAFATWCGWVVYRMYKEWP